MKPLNLPKESQEALINGASMFIVPLSSGQQNFEEYMIDPIDIISRYQIGDEVYINEPYGFDKNFNLIYEDDSAWFKVNHYSDMRPYQSRYKATIKDVKVVRVYDLFRFGYSALLGAWSKTEEDFKDWYNKQYGNYEDNPYVFVYEVKEIK
jgi:hypothetical protein